MEPTGEGLKAELQQLLSQLREARDELRLRAHLGSLEARDAWRDLQPEIDQAIAQARKVSEESVAGVRRALQRLLARPGGPDQPQPPA